MRFKHIIYMLYNMFVLIRVCCIIIWSIYGPIWIDRSFRFDSQSNQTDRLTIGNRPSLSMLPHKMYVPRTCVLRFLISYLLSTFHFDFVIDVVFCFLTKRHILFLFFFDKKVIFGHYQMAVDVCIYFLVYGINADFRSYNF